MSSPSTMSCEQSARKTQSTSTTEVAKGFHRFVIRNYSRVRGLAVGDCVRSSTFIVAGYEWSVAYYPGGADSKTLGYTPVYVRLMTLGVTVRMTFCAVVVNPDTGRIRAAQRTEPVLLDTRKGRCDERGFLMIEVRELEEKFVAGDDSVTVECGVCVILPSCTSSITRWLPDREIEAPAPDLPAHLAQLLASRGQADVTFDVRGEKFEAHAVVLAARSPVFEAELFGPLSHDRRRVKVHDVEPAVFRVLLDFIYTDTLPPDMDGDGTELARHLLVAADRYGMERLKVLCEGILSRNLTAQTVASTMALADRHNCHKLKDACVQFVVYLGLNNDAVASREDGQLNCLSFITHLWKKFSSILRIH